MPALLNLYQSRLPKEQGDLESDGEAQQFKD
jgi:hypothetical protein